METAIDEAIRVTHRLNTAILRQNNECRQAQGKTAPNTKHLEGGDFRLDGKLLLWSRLDALAECSIRIIIIIWLTIDLTSFKVD